MSKTPERSVPGKDGWEKTEILSRILAAIAVPIVVGILTCTYQNSASRRVADAQYVQLAVSILGRPDSTDVTPLRAWAVRLLDEHSPVSLDPDLKEALRSGSTYLPIVAFSSDSLSTGRSEIEVSNEIGVIQRDGSFRTLEEGAGHMLFGIRGVTGGSFAIRLVVVNLGGVAAYDVVITETVGGPGGPDGLLSLSVPEPGIGTVETRVNMIRWNVGTIGPAVGSSMIIRAMARKGGYVSRAVLRTSQIDSLVIERPVIVF